MHTGRRASIVSILVSAICIQAGCRDRAASTPRAGTSVGSTSGRESGLTCHLLGDVRLAPNTIGRIPTQETVEALWRLCPTATSDKAGVGGDASPALRFAIPGGSLWAIQSAYGYEDSLRLAERADLWAATGDSLRFPDGTLIPMRVGALRALDSIGVIVVDHGDDGGGSYIVRCKYPLIQIVIDNVWPSFAESGVVPLARASAQDTTSVWRVETRPGSAAGRAKVCAKATTT